MKLHMDAILTRAVVFDRSMMMSPVTWKLIAKFKSNLPRENSPVRTTIELLFISIALNLTRILFDSSNQKSGGSPHSLGMIIESEISNQ